LPDGDDAKDWQGHIQKKCYGCYCDEEADPMDQEMFAKTAAKSWKRRCNNVRHQQRSICFAKGLAKTEREDQESYRAWRKRVFKSAALLFAAFIAAFDDMDAEQQEDVEEALDAFFTAGEDIIQKKGFKEHSLGTIAKLLPDEAAQYASAITESIEEFYLCRARDPSNTGSWGPCGFFSLSKYWITTDVSFAAGHYRCPRCVTYYSPWKSGKPGQFIAANKLVIINNTKPGAKDVSIQVGKKQVVLEAGKMRFVPIWWPDSRVSDLHTRLKEVCLRLNDEVAGKPCVELIKMCQEMALNRALQQSFWQTMTMDPWVLQKMRDINAASTKEKWSWDHLQEPFFGLHYRMQDKEAALDETQLARIYATIRMTIKAARAAKATAKAKA
jgi:hypothetical protein